MPAAGRLLASQWIAALVARVPDQVAAAFGGSAFVGHRLRRLARSLPRRSPGEFAFPFGRVAYVDAASLRSQYAELFVQQQYDFECGHEAPFIIDCGGNIGMSVIRFKQRYPKSTIVTFEADPAIAAVLAKNVSNFGLTDVTVVNAAAWIASGSVSFAIDGADSGRLVGSGDGELISAVRLADYVDRPVDLLKMDIEGAEFDVLADLSESGALGKVERLIVEVHCGKAGWHRVAELIDALQRNAFVLCIQYACCAPHLHLERIPSPFSAVPDGKCLLHLYAWRDPERRC